MQRDNKILLIIGVIIFGVILFFLFQGQNNLNSLLFYNDGRNYADTNRFFSEQYASKDNNGRYVNPLDIQRADVQRYNADPTKIDKNALFNNYYTTIVQSGGSGGIVLPLHDANLFDLNFWKLFNVPNFLDKNQADGNYYPLNSNPAGYLTSATTDTNWETSFIVFDANMRATYLTFPDFNARMLLKENVADFNSDWNKATQNQNCPPGQVLQGIGLNFACVTSSAGNDTNLQTYGVFRTDTNSLFGLKDVNAINAKFDSNVLIGSAISLTNPGTHLSVAGKGVIVATTLPEIIGEFISTQPMTNGTGGGIAFGGYYESVPTGIVRGAGIKALKINSTSADYSFGLGIYTRRNGSGMARAGYFDQDGNLIMDPNHTINLSNSTTNVRLSVITPSGINGLVVGTQSATGDSSIILQNGAGTTATFAQLPAGVTPDHFAVITGAGYNYWLFEQPAMDVRRELRVYGNIAGLNYYGGLSAELYFGGAAFRMDSNAPQFHFTRPIVFDTNSYIGMGFAGDTSRVVYGCGIAGGAIGSSNTCGLRNRAALAGAGVSIMDSNTNGGANEFLLADFQYNQIAFYKDFNISGNMKVVGSLNLYDNNSLFFGDASDASIKYDGTNLIINPKLVGSGQLTIPSDVNIYTTGATGLVVKSDTYPATWFKRTTTTTNGVNVAHTIEDITSNDMTDGFGAGLEFRIQDNAGVSNPIGQFSVVRAGADNSGAFNITTYNAGSPTIKMSVRPDGNIGVGDTMLSPIAKMDINGDLKVRDNANFDTNIFFTNTGGTIYYKKGSNACIGTGVLVSGDATISTTCSVVGAYVFVTDLNITHAGNESLGVTRIANGQFDVNSVGTTDNSSFEWLILKGV